MVRPSELTWRAQVILEIGCELGYVLVGDGRVGDLVDRAGDLFGMPCHLDLTAGITGTQQPDESGVADLVEPIVLTTLGFRRPPECRPAGLTLDAVLPFLFTGQHSYWEVRVEVAFSELTREDGLQPEGVRIFLSDLFSSDSEDFVALVTDPLGFLIDAGIPNVDAEWLVSLLMPNSELLAMGNNGSTAVATIESQKRAVVTYLKQDDGAPSN